MQRLLESPTARKEVNRDDVLRMADVRTRELAQGGGPDDGRVRVVLAVITLGIVVTLGLLSKGIDGALNNVISYL